MNLGYEDVELIDSIVDIEEQLTERIEDVFLGEVLDIEVSREGADFVAFAAVERDCDGWLPDCNRRGLPRPCAGGRASSLSN